MGTLYAGPWVGEFGWELCWWNPMLRHIAKRERVIVSARESSKYLYEFATEFFSVEGASVEFSEGKVTSPLPQVVADKFLDPQEAFNTDRAAARLQCRPGRKWRRRGVPLVWRDLRPTSCERVANVLCAFRPPKIDRDGKVVDGKDYPVTMCREVVEMLLSSGLSVACYGGSDNYHFDGTVDLRGKPLEEQCSALAGARCTVGPSSGPLHLSSLCRCPHVTWFGAPSQSKSYIASRYEFQWNPFGTPVSFMPQHLPSPSAIVMAIESMMKGTT